MENKREGVEDKMYSAYNIVNPDPIPPKEAHGLNNHLWSDFKLIYMIFFEGGGWAFNYISVEIQKWLS